MKQLEVQIMGQSYLLGCPENGDARMLDAVNRVDIAMSKIRDAGKIKARDRIAVLAALNFAFELAGRPVEAALPAAHAPELTPGAQADPPPHHGAFSPSLKPELTALVQRLDAALRDGADLL